MLKKLMGLVLFASLYAPAFAYVQDEVYVRGILPTENITSLEIKPRFKAKDDSANKTVATVEIKPSFKLNKNWKFQSEIPVLRMSDGDYTQKGLGDIMVAGYYTQYSPDKVFSYGVGSELVMPTATYRDLGDGKWVAEPEIFLVWKLSPRFFVETEYRHIFSFAGSSGREDINASRYRMILGYVSPNHWWFEFDPRYTVDYVNKSEAELIGEFELGTMINVGTSAYIRGGWHLAGNKYSQDWELMLGFKILYF